MDILLHNNNAIGIRPDSRTIALHKDLSNGWMIGIRMNADLRHYRKAGSTGGFMTLDSLELQIPALESVYTSRIEGWQSLKSEGYIEYFKPGKCLLLPKSGEQNTFCLLDEYDEIDPYFYFGWGLRSDQMPPYGYRRRAIVGYMGVNYPVEDGFAPEFTGIPTEIELFSMLKPSAPIGQWCVRAHLSGFTVDSEVNLDSYAAFLVWEGWSRFWRAQLDFVKPNARVIGKCNVDWSDINWGSTNAPGDLSINSGTASGMHFRTIGQSYTGDYPPPGYPPKTWLIFTHPSDPIPSLCGVTPGDKFQLTSPFENQLFKLVHYKHTFEPGTYPPIDYEFPFELMI
jgi:hypothetical protein